MPGRVPLSQSDIAGEPAREVAYYGGVRQGFEQARAGLESVIQHLEGLFQKDPNNIRLQRYLTQLNKLLTKMHKLQMRSSRVRDRLVERKKTREKDPGWHEFGNPANKGTHPSLWGEHQEREDSLKNMDPYDPSGEKEKNLRRRHP